MPGKFQLLWEMAVEAVQRQVDDSIGPRGAKVVPLALTLFVFIFTCNLFEVARHRQHHTTSCPPRPATSTCPLAMALYVFVLVQQGRHPEPRRWSATSALPQAAVLAQMLFPINLFMNVHRGDRQAGHPHPPAVRQPVRRRPDALAAGRPGHLEARARSRSAASLSVPFTVVWKLFDMAIGAIQAFIFALLTILYFDTAMAPDEAH